MRRAVGLLALVVTFASLARAQDGPPLEERRRAVREGTHVFRRILADAELEPVATWEDLAREPRTGVLIVLGNLDVLGRLPGGLEKFVAAGGAVLLASDRAVTNPDVRKALLKTAGVTINSETLLCQNRKQCYKGLDYCPHVVPWQPPDPHLFRTPEGSQVNLATNTPSMLLPRYIDGDRLRLPIMATLPLECVIEAPDGRPLPAVRNAERDFNGNPDPNNIRNFPAFMVGGDVGPGRVLVLADHSVFINEMMMPTDNQNVEFTYNAVAWLRGDDKARTRALFVEEGHIKTEFDLPVKSGTIPPREALELLFAKRNELLVKVEEKLAEWEDEAVYDNKVIDWLSNRGLPPSRLAHLAVAIGTVLLMLLMLARLAFRYRFAHDTTAPALVSAVGGHFPTRPLAEQRTLAMIRQDNVIEAAAALVRAWFARQGVDVAAGGAPPPPFRCAGGWGERRRRARRLRQLYELASGRSAQPVRAPEIWKLQRELEQLAAGRQRGEWGVT